MKFKKFFFVILIIVILALAFYFLYYKNYKNSKTEKTSSNSVSIADTSSENVVEDEVPPAPAKTPAEEKLSQMTLDEKIGQLFIVRPESLNVSTEVTDATRKLFKSISCWRNRSI